jgi:hypothetical protein
VDYEYWTQSSGNAVGMFFCLMIWVAEQAVLPVAGCHAPNALSGRAGPLKTLHYYAAEQDDLATASAPTLGGGDTDGPIELCSAPGAASTKSMLDCHVCSLTYTYLAKSGFCDCQGQSQWRIQNAWDTL